MDKITVE